MDERKRCALGAWQRCETCRKVLAAEAFDSDSATCRACLAAPTPRVRTTRASAVRTVRSAATETAPVAPADRRPLLGVAGSGDLEVRERRAKRAAYDQLAEAHAEEYEQLLQAARQAEGLRSS